MKNNAANHEQIQTIRYKHMEEQNVTKMRS